MSSGIIDDAFVHGVAPNVRRIAAAVGLLAVVCPVLALYRPGAASAPAVFEQATGDTPSERLLSAVEAARQAGRLAEADTLLQNASQRLRTDSAAPRVRLRFFDAAADLNTDLRRFPDAVAAIEQAVALAGSLYGVDHREVAYRYERMSLLYEKMGQPNAALLSREKALRLAEKDAGVSRDTLALRFNNLGELYRRRADFARADDAYRTALTLMIARHGASAPETAFPLNNLGLSALAQGNFDVADSYLQRAIAVSTATSTRQRIEANRRVVREARVHGVPASLKPPVIDPLDE